MFDGSQDDSSRYEELAVCLLSLDGQVDGGEFGRLGSIEFGGNNPGLGSGVSTHLVQVLMRSLEE